MNTKNKKKILFIDYVAPIGHIQFDKIHIEALCKCGEVHTIMRKGFYNKINVPEAINEFEIPEYFYSWEFEGKVMMYIRIILNKFFGKNIIERQCIKYVRNRIKDHWDAIVFSSAEPRSLSGMKELQSKVFFIVHVYEDMLYSWPKRVDDNVKFSLDIGKRYHAIALNEDMKKSLKELGIEHVDVVPHGFLPYDNQRDDSVYDEFCIPRDRKMVFSPSYKHEEQFAELVLRDESFNKFLEENNLVLVIKARKEESQNSNVIIIDKWISAVKYRTLLADCNCVITPYPPKKLNRESGVVVECIANNKPCIRPNVESLRRYDKYFGYQSIYNSFDEFKKLLLETTNDDESRQLYKEQDDLSNPSPAWQRLLEE